MRFFLVFVFGTFLCAIAREAAAQSDPAELVKEGKGLFAAKDWTRALGKFKLAQQLGAKEEVSLEVALYIGAIYAETGQSALAEENLRKYLSTHPEAGAPATFTEKMTAALEEARKGFPIIKDVAIEKEVFKPYLESLGITFSVTAAQKALENTSVRFYIFDSIRRETALEIVPKFDRTTPTQRVEFNGKDKNGAFLRTGSYIFTLEALREDGWKFTAECPVSVSENLQTPKAVALTKKVQRAEQLSGQSLIDLIPDKPFVVVGEKPIKGTKKGTLYYIYYIPVGAIRDGVDLPVKFVCSLPVAGQVMSFVFFAGAGYAIGQSAWTPDKSDYYDPMTGFDKSGYNSDKKAAQMGSVGTAILAPVWFVIYAGLMSATSWAGTDDGIESGFNSYIESNAFRKGYDSKYFFPNYRSLVHTATVVDEEELARMEAQVERTNALIRSEIVSTNRGAELFNRNQMEPFKRAIAEKYNKELYDFVEMSIKKSGR
jgi:hypothetical protein